MGYSEDGTHRRPERDNPQGDGAVDDKVGFVPIKIFSKGLSLPPFLTVPVLIE